MTDLQFLARARRGYTLVEITLVVIILGILTIFAVRQLDGSDSARAQELQAVAARMAGDWTLMAASCSIGTDADKTTLGSNGSMTVMVNGVAGLPPAFQACIGATGFKPLADVLQASTTAVSLENYPVTLSGGVSQPFTVTYGNVPIGVATDAALKFAAVAPALPLPSSNQTDARVRWQRQADGDYTVQFLFDRMVVAAATPSPWAAATAPSVAMLTPVNLSPTPVATQTLGSNGGPALNPMQGGGPSIHPPQCTGSSCLTGCVTNCGTVSPPPCTGSSCQPACVTNCGSVSPPSTGCAGNFTTNFGSSSSGPGSSATSGGGYTANNGTTTGTNNYTTSAGTGSATADGGGTNTTTGNGSGPVSQNAGNCNQTSASGNGGSASTNGGSWAGGSAGGNGTVTTTTWGTGNSSTGNGTGNASSSSGGGSSSVSNGGSGLSLSAGGGGTTSGAGSTY